VRRARSLALLALAFGCASARETPLPGHALEGGRYAMGTVLEVSLHGPDEAALLRARDAVFAVAERLDGLLSRYEPTSDVSRLNGSAGRPVRVDPTVASLLRRSLAFAARTEGAFDVTVGPLVSLWMLAAVRDRLPGHDEIASARDRVGSGHVHFEEDGRVSLDPGSHVDLGGVAKGFALDRMLPVLRREGVSAALLSFGQSSVWAFGTPPDADGWRLLARAPDGGFAGVVTLRDRALSVSGSLGQWSEIGGRRFGHVLDPRTGWPLTRRRQALVVGPDGTLTEVLSTALLILGEGEGMALVEAEPDCEALLLDADGKRFASSGFDAVTSFEPLPSDGGAGGAQDRGPAVRTLGHGQAAFLPGV
jgi:thiamine biosynthesis lipoprotein